MIECFKSGLTDRNEQDHDISININDCFIYIIVFGKINMASKAKKKK